MPYTATDEIFLVTKPDGSESRHIRADKLFSGIADDWYVLVNENGVSKRCLVSQLPDKASDDRYMLVNVGDKSYKIKSSTVAAAAGGDVGYGSIDTLSDAIKVNYASHPSNVRAPWVFSAWYYCRGYGSGSNNYLVYAFKNDFDWSALQNGTLDVKMRTGGQSVTSTNIFLNLNEWNHFYARAYETNTDPRNEVYINGQLVTLSRGFSNARQGCNLGIGGFPDVVGLETFDGLVANVDVISDPLGNGETLVSSADISKFGKLNGSGQWVAVGYDGDYGQYGYKMRFPDNNPLEVENPDLVWTPDLSASTLSTGQWSSDLPPTS